MKTAEDRPAKETRKWQGFDVAVKQLNKVDASASAALALFAEPTAAARAEALRRLDRRREVATADLLAAAEAAETDEALREAFAAMRAGLLLADPEPLLRQIADAVGLPFAQGLVEVQGDRKSVV
jgi:soluble lytic murein transglycosylase-like protein